MNKKLLISSVLVIILALSIFYFSNKNDNRDEIVLETSPPFSHEESPAASSLSSPSSSPRVTKIPSPTGDGRTSFIGETVPWNLLLADAFCKLNGEVKFLDHNTYDNQDALFTYIGIDHPARNVLWAVSPQDDIRVGPNILNKTPIPNGESLLGIVLPDNPKYKKYELTAKIQYGRLVDQKGNFVTAGGYVKVFEKQCDGKTIVVLP